MKKILEQGILMGIGYLQKKELLEMDKYRLISLNLASTGLAFVELGKGNVLQIQRSITGPVLAGRKVKTKEKYTIPVTPKVEQWIVEMDHYHGNHLLKII